MTGVQPSRGYTYTMLSRTPGDDQTGRVTLEPIGPNRTRFSFEERYNLTKLPWRWFEGPIYKFINRNNEASMRRRRSGSPTTPTTDRTWPDAVEPSRRLREDRSRTHLSSDCSSYRSRVLGGGSTTRR